VKKALTVVADLGQVKQILEQLHKRQVLGVRWQNIASIKK